MAVNGKKMVKDFYADLRRQYMLHYKVAKSKDVIVLPSGGSITPATPAQEPKLAKNTTGASKDDHDKSLS